MKRTTSIVARSNGFLHVRKNPSSIESLQLSLVLLHISRGSGGCNYSSDFLQRNLQFWYPAEQSEESQQILPQGEVDLHNPFSFCMMKAINISSTGVVYPTPRWTAGKFWLLILLCWLISRETLPWRSWWTLSIVQTGCRSLFCHSLHTSCLYHYQCPWSSSYHQLFWFCCFSETSVSIQEGTKPNNTHKRHIHYATEQPGERELLLLQRKHSSSLTTSTCLSYLSQFHAGSRRDKVLFTSCRNRRRMSYIKVKYDTGSTITVIQGENLLSVFTLLPVVQIQKKGKYDLTDEEKLQKNTSQVSDKEIKYRSKDHCMDAINGTNLFCYTLYSFLSLVAAKCGYKLERRWMETRKHNQGECDVEVYMLFRKWILVPFL